MREASTPSSTLPSSIITRVIIMIFIKIIVIIRTTLMITPFLLKHCLFLSRKHIFFRSMEATYTEVTREVSVSNWLSSQLSSIIIHCDFVQVTATPLPDLEEVVEVSLQPASALLESPTPTRYGRPAGVCLLVLVAVVVVSNITRGGSEILISPSLTVIILGAALLMRCELRKDKRNKTMFRLNQDL